MAESPLCCLFPSLSAAQPATRRLLEYAYTFLPPPRARSQRAAKRDLLGALCCSCLRSCASHSRLTLTDFLRQQTVDEVLPTERVTTFATTNLVTSFASTNLLLGAVQESAGGQALKRREG